MSNSKIERSKCTEPNRLVKNRTETKPKLNMLGSGLGCVGAKPN